MSNNRPRRAGPVWLWALVLLVILITLFVLLRRDAAAHEAGAFRDSYSSINKSHVANLPVDVSGEPRMSRVRPDRHPITP